MSILELQTAEGLYKNDMERDCHFSIDCACCGKNGRYKGSHYKNTGEFFKQVVDEYKPLRDSMYEHTFMLNEVLFLSQLVEEHRECRGNSPLTIVCDDCGREFQFTHESYLHLRKKMMVQCNDRKLA